MFKNVEYVGFEGQPEREAMARRANDLLGAVINDWHNEVGVTWRPTQAGSAEVLDLTLSLALWNATGTATGSVRRRGFETGEEHQLRIDLRETWLKLLGQLSRQQMKRLDEVVFEPAEV